MKITRERLIIVALLILLAFLGVRGCMSQQEKNVEYKNVIVQRNDSLQHYKDYAGREHGKRMQVEADIQTVKLLYGGIVDSLVKSNGIKAKQIESFALLGVQYSDNVDAIMDTIVVDSTKSLRIRYTDKWVNITGIAGKLSTINYSFSDSLIVSTYWKRKNIFGRKTTYVDAYSLNPKAHIRGLESVKVTTERRRPFGIGPYVGYGFNGTSWQPSIGISLTYDIIKF